MKATEVKCFFYKTGGIQRNTLYTFHSVVADEPKKDFIIAFSYFSSSRIDYIMTSSSLEAFFAQSIHVWWSVYHANAAAAAVCVDKMHYIIPSTHQRLTSPGARTKDYPVVFPEQLARR